MQLFKIIKKINGFILDTLFPVYCYGCKKEGEILCENCLQKIKINERETGENIIAVFDYQDYLIKKIIWNLKYHNQKNIGKKLGQILFEFTKNEISEINFLTSGKPIIVIPVPSSPKRFKERGYNHAEILAKKFCQENPENLEFNKNIVFKKIETKHQAKISNKKARLKNIKNSFGINPNTTIKGRSIFVIDDVTTTGGTFLEINKILKKAGAKKVLGIALAH